MKNIYYFSSLDLVVRICQSQGKRIIHFTTHRPAEKEELRQVETFIAKQFDLQKSPSSVQDEAVYLLYLGVEESLPTSNTYQLLQGTIKDVITKKQTIDQQVKELIDASMSTYYFEKLGEKLISLRRAIHHQAGSQHIGKMVQEIGLLLDAYNHHAGQNLSLNQILPREASPHNNEG